MSCCLKYLFDRVDAAVRRGHVLSLPRRSRSSAGLSAPQDLTRSRSAADTSPSGHHDSRAELTERGGGTHPRPVRLMSRTVDMRCIGGRSIAGISADLGAVIPPTRRRSAAIFCADRHGADRQ
jgi:hypothetical protein